MVKLQDSTEFENEYDDYGYDQEGHEDLGHDDYDGYDGYDDYDEEGFTEYDDSDFEQLKLSLVSVLQDLALLLRLRHLAQMTNNLTQTLKNQKRANLKQVLPSKTMGQAALKLPIMQLKMPSKTWRNLLKLKKLSKMLKKLSKKLRKQNKRLQLTKWKKTIHFGLFLKQQVSL